MLSDSANCTRCVDFHHQHNTPLNSKLAFHDHSERTKSRNSNNSPEKDKPRKMKKIRLKPQSFWMKMMKSTLTRHIKSSSRNESKNEEDQLPVTNTPQLKCHRKIWSQTNLLVDQTKEDDKIETTPVWRKINKVENSQIKVTLKSQEQTKARRVIFIKKYFNSPRTPI